MIDHIFTLFSGFLVAIAIAAVTAWLQQRNWKNQDNVRSRDRERESAISVVADLSELIGKRLYRQKRLLWAVKRGEVGHDVPDFNDYRDALLEWNDRLGQVQVKLEYSFGRSVMLKLERHFQKKLSKSHEVIWGVHEGSIDKDTLVSVESQLNKLTGDANSFTEELLDRIRSMDISGYAEYDVVKFANRKNLSISFLFFRLLGMLDKRY